MTIFKSDTPNCQKRKKESPMNPSCVQIWCGNSEFNDNNSKKFQSRTALHAKVNAPTESEGWADAYNRTYKRTQMELCCHVEIYFFKQP